MMTDNDRPNSSDSTVDNVGEPPRSGAAERALAEAEARRGAYRRAEHNRPREIDGRQGPEPVRYGDWENKGIASDF